MTPHIRLDDSLRWRAVGKLAGQFKVRWLQVTPKWSTSCGINSKQVVLLPGGYRFLHLTRDLAAVSGRRISRQKVYSRLAFTHRVHSGASFLLHPAEKIEIGYCGTENISQGHHKNGVVFFSVMSRNVPNKVIFIESSPGEKMKLVFLPPT
ncbi:hypothetical protein TNCV_1328891 [Trichonephila clavipes]|nr:hypothetical protein TNCV_1328891 [Trichonephila clavipes]